MSISIGKDTTLAQTSFPMFFFFFYENSTLTLRHLHFTNLYFHTRQSYSPYIKSKSKG